MNARALDSKLLNIQTEILKMLTTGRSLTEVLETLAKEIESISLNTFCSIILYNELDNTLGDAIGPSMDPAYLNAFNGVKIGPNVGSCGTAAFRKETVIVKDIKTDILWKNHKSIPLSFGLRSCWSKPIIFSDEKVLGTFALYYKEPREPKIEELQLLETFTDLAAVSIEQSRINEKLYQSEEQYRLLAENASAFLGIITKQGMYEYVSSSHERYLGYSSQELLGKFWLDYIHPEDVEYMIEEFNLLLVTEQERKVIFRFKHIDGHWLYIDASATPLQDNQGNVSRYVFVARDVSEKINSEQQLKIVLEELEKTKIKFDSLFNNSLEAIFEIDHEGKYIRVNSGVEILTGYRKKELLGMSYDELVALNHLEEVRESLNKVKQGEAISGEIILIHKNGHSIIVDYSAVPIYQDGAVMQVIVFVQDITKKRHAENEIANLAYKDVLTGLPNRYFFSMRLDEAISRAKEKKNTFGILFIDIDNFKAVNDTLGHHIGDLLLQNIVTVIRNCLGEDVLISRQGGDEFLLLIEDSNKNELSRISQTIIDVMKNPFILDGNVVFISPSIGVSLFPEFGLDSEDLIKYADIAMYSAKEMGKNNFQFYSNLLNEKVLRKSLLENALRVAVNNNELTLNFQPKFELDTNRIEGIEALLRWNPDFGIVSPAEFIPIAEDTGLIVEIGEWVLKEACEKNKIWNDMGLLEVPIAVNVSARQFKEPNFIKTVAKVLRDTKLPPKLLEIEITESVMIDVVDACLIINQLRNMGVRIAIDDFGVGHSSLNMLKNIDIDNLKIDQSFLEDVMINKKSAALLEAIINIGREMGSNVVVEGVETEEQVNFLLNKGIIAQGYYFSRPLSVEKLEDYLQLTSFKEK